MWYRHVKYYLAIKKHEIRSVAETSMDLETVIKNEVRKRKVDIIH